MEENNEKQFVITESQIVEINEYLKNHRLLLINNILRNLPELEEVNKEVIKKNQENIGNTTENNDLNSIIKNDEDISG